MICSEPFALSELVAWNSLPLCICPSIYFNTDITCNYPFHHVMLWWCHALFGGKPTCMSHSSLVVSKHGLYAGSPGSIPTAITTRTAAGGDAEHVSLNHWLAPPYQGVKLVPAKCWEDSYRRWPWVGCKRLLSHHLKVMAHTKVGWVPCWELKCKVVR